MLAYTLNNIIYVCHRIIYIYISVTRLKDVFRLFSVCVWGASLIRVYTFACQKNIRKADGVDCLSYHLFRNMKHQLFDQKLCG